MCSGPVLQSIRPLLPLPKLMVGTSSLPLTMLRNDVGVFNGAGSGPGSVALVRLSGFGAELPMVVAVCH